MNGPEPPTLSIASWAYGDEPPRYDDPTETFHEASRLYPNLVDSTVMGGPRLLRSRELRASAARAVRRRAGLPAVALPEPVGLEESLSGVIRRRRSVREYAAQPLSLAALTTLLACAYGVTEHTTMLGQPLRTVPSGGALYPLELYVAAVDVSGLGAGLYHYDPLRSVLERVRPLSRDDLVGLTPYDELLVPSAAVTAVAGVFWRSRFKYGARAYRFALLEAGHAAQNYLLAATALGLAAPPVGGFFDRRVDALLGVDGVYEASLYLLPVGVAIEA